MGALKLFEIFRAGRHTANNGLTFDYSADHLNCMAAAYSPGRLSAPLVLGHPQDQDAAPQFGSVARVIAREGRLYALAMVADALIDLVRAAHYRKVSASFALPDAAGNPVPGAYYLRHVGFLGAHPPGVKGLAPLAFGENGTAVSFCTDIPGGISAAEGINAPAGYRVGDAHRLAAHRAAIHMQHTCPALSYCEAVSLAEGVATFNS